MKHLNVKAVNTVTGKFFVIGKGFSADCIHKATSLTPAQMAVVKHSFLNVVEVFSQNKGHSPEWPECGCDDCQKIAY